jgi:WD40 repeat protein
LYALLQRAQYRYDIFISYSRSDGTAYAENLKKRLTQLDFTCFLDHDDLSAGLPLTPSLKRALRRSARLIVVATKGAVQSEYVPLEVTEFSATGRTIIPIDIAGAIRGAAWPALHAKELIWLDESAEAFHRSAPSEVVVNGIDKAYKFMRRNTFVRLQALAIFLLFAVGVATAYVVLRKQQAAVQNEQSRNKTLIVQLKAEQGRLIKERQKTQNATAELKLKQKEADENLTDTIQEQGRFEWLRGRYPESLSYLSDAYRRRQGDEPLRFLLHAATRAPVPVLHGGGHRGEAMKSAAWSPDGERLLTVDEREVRLWNAAGELLTILRRGRRPIRAFDARFIHGGKEILAFGPDAVNVCSQQGNCRNLPIDHSHLVAADISADEKTLSLCTDKQLVVMPFKRSGTTLRFPIRDCKSARVHQDGKRAAIDGDDGIDFYELATGTKTGQIADAMNVDELIWSPTDPLLVAMHKEDVDGHPVYKATFIAKNAEEKLVTREIESTLPVVFSPDGGYVLAADDHGKADVWKVLSIMDPNVGAVQRLSHGDIADPTERQLAVVGEAAFSFDNSRLVTASSGEVDSKGIRLWDVHTGTLAGLLSGQNTSLTHLEFSFDGRRLVTTDENGSGRIWRTDKDLRKVHIDDAEWEEWRESTAIVDREATKVITRGLKPVEFETGETPRAELVIRDVHTGKRHGCDSGAFTNVAPNADGTLVAVSGDGEEVRIISTTDCSVRATFREAASRNNRPVRCLFLYSGMLLTWRGSEARLWDPRHCSAPLRVFRVPRSSHTIDHVVVSLGSNLLIGAGGSLNVPTVIEYDVVAGTSNVPNVHKATVWDLTTGAVLYTVDASSMALGPDGLTLAAAVGATVNVYEPRSGKLLGAYREHLRPVTLIAYDSEGKRIITCSGDRTARVWDPHTRKNLMSLQDDQFPITYAAFSPQGGRIVTAANLTLRVWDAKRGSLLTTLSGHAQPIRSVRFSNDGASLVSLGTSEVMLWDVALETRTPGEISTWMKHAFTMAGSQ